MLKANELKEGDRVFVVRSDGDLLEAELAIIHRGVGIVRFECGKTDVLPLDRIHASRSTAASEAISILETRAGRLLVEHRLVTEMIAKFRYQGLDANSRRA